jgi:uncharacterized cupredoxin-like copper-binding protein
MSHFRFTAPVAAMLAVFVPAASALAAEVEPPQIAVKLWNKSDGSMGITLDKTQVPAGPVELNISNTSKNMMHEALVAPWSGSPTALPYSNKTASVKESAVPGLQGQEDMKPGLKTTVLLNLKPGTYVIFCNQPGHYKMGMYATFKAS